MIPELWQTKFFIMNPLMDHSDHMEKYFTNLEL